MGGQNLESSQAPTLCAWRQARAQRASGRRAGRLVAPALPLEEGAQLAVDVVKLAGGEAQAHGGIRLARGGLRQVALLQAAREAVDLVAERAHAADAETAVSIGGRGAGRGARLRRLV